MISLLKEHLKIARIHALRIKEAREAINHLFPFTPAIIEELTCSDIAFLELYTNRFSKLQDLIGAKMFPEILLLYGEDLQALFFIDRLNKMEKIGILNDAQEWLYMRKISKQLSHEYPENPEFLADNLNIICKLEPELLACLANIEKLAKTMI
ncbi:MAG: hypothetical protein COA94_07005 [Rickettsiales bacterium]|nr:MAG: hypothetical protein COA94_07005 [Rickettsiales bacterium]